MQLAEKVLLALCYESVWLHHIDILFKITIQERCLDIHLPFLIIKLCYTMDRSILIDLNMTIGENALL